MVVGVQKGAALDLTAREDYYVPSESIIGIDWGSPGIVRSL